MMAKPLETFRTHVKDYLKGSMPEMTSESFFGKHLKGNKHTFDIQNDLHGPRFYPWLSTITCYY